MLGQMTRRNLILIHRGPEYEEDFKEISEKIFALDPDITIYALAAGSDDQLPEAAWQRPTLTVALNPVFNLRVRRGPVLKNYQIDKLVQQRIFREAGIATPPMLPFTIGMRLDPIMFGEFVVIKPMSLDLTSHGDGIQIFRRRRLEDMQQRDFPQEHPIHRDRQGYLVQKFVDTGEYPTQHRLLSLFGERLFHYRTISSDARKSLGAANEELEKSIIATQSASHRRRELVSDARFAETARKLHSQLPEIPLLGIDILVEPATSRHFVIEINAGGNTWGFSSSLAAPLRRELGQQNARGGRKFDRVGKKLLKEQFGAFDLAAKVLLEKTCLAAS